MSVQPIDIGAVKFKLRFNNTNKEYWIDPPVGWDKMPIELKRGGKYSRMIKFGEEQELEFWKRTPLEHGQRLDLLIEYHKTYGDESFVEFLLYVDDNLLLTAELDFKNATTDRESFFKAKLIVNDLNKLVAELEDTKIDVYGIESLKGNFNPPAPTETVLLMPKKIREIAKHVLGTEDGEESNVDWEVNRTFPNTNGEELIIENPWGYLKMNQNEDAAGYYVAPDTPHTNPGPGLNVSSSYTGVGVLGQIANYYFKVPTDFSLEVNNVNIKYDGNGVANNKVRIYLLMAIITYDNENHDNVTSQHYEILSDTIGKEVTINTEWQGIIPKYSRIIFETRVYVTFRNGRTWSKTTINVEGQMIGYTVGLYPATKAKMTRLINAGKKILSNYTENQAIVTAPRFESGGEFWWYYITSGYYIRGFEGSSYDLSFKQWKEFIQNAFNCDVQISGNNIFIGKQEDFYRDIEVARLPFKPEIDSYEIGFNQDLIVNGLKIGYDKFEDDEAETMDAFHTESEWYIPKRNKGSLDIKIPFTADGYSIEYARREGIDAEPTTAKSKDDDTYIVDCFVNTVHLPPPLNIALNILQNRQNQGYAMVNGIYSPETAYNLRLSLKRLLIDHYKFRLAEIGQKLNNGTPIPSTIFAKNTFFKANGELFTWAQPALPTTPTPLKDNDSIKKSQLPSPIIGPEIYSFTLSMRMKYDRLIALYNDIINECGYVTLYTDDTELKIYPFDMKYDWQKELLTFNAERKYEI